MYFDLGMEYRDKTNDQVGDRCRQRHQEGRCRRQMRHHHPDKARVKEFGLKEM
jgi:isocitrate dehydrogenase